MIEHEYPSPETAGPEINPADIRLAAMNLLARREHSLAELREKLRRRFGDEQLLEAQLQQLVAENLQSDDRYAESFVRQRATRGHGRGRVEQELRARGVAEDLVASAFERAEVDWYAVAEAVYRKKFGEPGAVELKEKARRMRFMQYRGFSAEYYQHLVDS